VTTIGYVPAASVVAASTISLELSGTAVLTTFTTRPPGAPVTAYLTGLARPPLRVAVTNVLTLPPDVTARVGAPTAIANAGIIDVPVASLELHACAAATIVTTPSAERLCRKEVERTI
jgi:hypothetical protein